MMAGAIYIEFTFSSESEYAYEILTAELADQGFESFSEEEGALKAYIQKDILDANALDETLTRLLHKFSFSYTQKEIAPQNWNAVWESNFTDITVENKLRVRAVFHEPSPSYPIEIIIQPKMSFGTGHHATTWLVMSEMLELGFINKSVLDFGTGTGILAILAEKLGAADIWAVDNDAQCIENSQENFELNGTSGIRLALGDITAAPEGKNFDIIIGNITRNVILQFLPQIRSCLEPGGLFLASGFYGDDLEIISGEAFSLNMLLQRHRLRDKWCMAVFKRV
jgi:ribosomal protein L11 methyltransferase